jgi:hypothetical protein
MNSLYKMCKSIDSKLDKLHKKFESLESKLETLEIKTATVTNSTQSSAQLSTKPTISIKTKKKRTSPSYTASPTSDKSGSIIMTQYVDKVLITGDTFEKKVFIKKYRGQWSPEHKGWLVYTNQNIKELKKTLRKTSLQFSYNTIDTNINGSEPSVNIPKSSVTEDKVLGDNYAFIEDD